MAILTTNMKPPLPADFVSICVVFEVLGNWSQRGLYERLIFRQIQTSSVKSILIAKDFEIEHLTVRIIGLNYVFQLNLSHVCHCWNCKVLALNCPASPLLSSVATFLPRTYVL